MQWFSPVPDEADEQVAAAGSASASSSSSASRAGGGGMASAASQSAAALQTRPSQTNAARAPAGVGTLPFYSLCLLLEKLERSKSAPARPGGGPARRSAPGRLERCGRTLDAFFDRCASLGGDPLPLLVLMLPDADLERRFDCKETTLVKLLLKGFGLARTRTADALTRWRTGALHSATSQAAAAAAAGGPALSPGQGDLSLTIHSLLATYAASVPTLSVAQVNSRLDSLAARSAWTDQTFKDGLALRRVTLDADEPPVGPGLPGADAAADQEPPDSAAQLIFQLYSRCTSLEHKWLTRIILRDLCVGLKARVFMHAFHPHLYPIYLRRGSLREACHAVRQLMQAEHFAPSAPSSSAAATPSASVVRASGSKRKRAASFDDDGEDDVEEEAARADPSSLLSQLMAPQLGSFVQVMLCQRAHSVPFAEQRFAGREISVMNKYDGERVQIHVWRNDRGTHAGAAHSTAAAHSAAASSSAAATAMPAWTASAIAPSSYEAMSSASFAVDHSGTYVSPHSPFSVRIFSRSARNSTRDRCKCIPYILAALGLQALPYDHHQLYSPSPAPATQPEPDPGAAAATHPACKVEGEPFAASSMMPPLERPFQSAAAATSFPPLSRPGVLEPTTIEGQLLDPTGAESIGDPFVPSAFGRTFESAIFDGELVIYNEVSSEIEPFGGLRDLVPWGVPRVGTSGPGNVHRRTYEHRHHCLVLFDALHLNGESLMHHPQKNRYKLLQYAISRPVHKFVQVASQWLIRMPSATAAPAASSGSFPSSASAGCSSKRLVGPSSAAAAGASSLPVPAPTLHSLYLECVSQAQEGLILKDAASRYVPNYRGHWMKLKKDYIAGFGDTVDLCIVGAVFGMGAQGGLLNCFVLAARRDDEADSAGAAAAGAQPPLRFQALFDVGIGLTASEQQHMHALLAPLCRPYTRASCPPWLSLPPGHKVDVVLRDPRRAPVAEVLGAGFLQGILRFPRIQRLKLGSDYTAALGLEEYCTIAAQACQRLDPQERQQIEGRMLQLAQEMQHTKGKPQGARQSRLDYSKPIPTTRDDPTAAVAAAAAATVATSSIAAVQHSGPIPAHATPAVSMLKLESSPIKLETSPAHARRAASFSASIDLTLDSPLRLRGDRSPGGATGAFSSSSVSATTTPTGGGCEDADEDECELQLDWSMDLEPLKEEEEGEEEEEEETIVKMEEGADEERKSDGKVKQEPVDATSAAAAVSARPPSMAARELFPALLAVKIEPEEELSVGPAMLSNSLTSPPRRVRSRKRRSKWRSPPEVDSPATPASGGSVTSRGRTTPRNDSFLLLIDAAPVPLQQVTTTVASLEPASGAASAPVRVNPKKEWECPFSAGRGYHSCSQRTKVPSTPAVRHPCECRRHVWLDEGVTVGEAARRVLTALGFVLHEADAFGSQPSFPFPGIVITSEQRVEQISLRLQQRCASEVAPSSLRCPPRPVWLVDGRFAEKLGASTSAPLTDGAALRKRLYSALAHALLASCNHSGGAATLDQEPKIHRLQ